MQLLRGPVCILDNDQLMIDSLKRLLILGGFQVHSYEDAQSAIIGYQALKDTGCVPQVFLIDGALGGDLNGVEVACRIAQIDSDNETALIAYTSYPFATVSEMSPNSRFESVVDKTDGIELLILEINRVLKRRQQEAEHTARDHT